MGVIRAAPDIGSGEKSKSARRGDLLGCRRLEEGR